MRNCMILGSGRSGTSLVAGVLGNSGYFMGDKILQPTEGNPKGYFEDLEVNHINELILEPVVPKRPRFLRKWFFHDRPVRNQRWLARLPLDTEFPTSQKTIQRIQEITKWEPSS